MKDLLEKNQQLLRQMLKELPVDVEIIEKMIHENEDYLLSEFKLVNPKNDLHITPKAVVFSSLGGFDSNMKKNLDLSEKICSDLALYMAHKKFNIKLDIENNNLLFVENKFSNENKKDG